MFENLSDRLERSFKILKGEGKLTLGNDIDKVKYAILPNFQEDEVMGALADVAKKGLDLPVRGDFSWTMSEANKETIILVGLNRAGQQVAYQWGTCYYLDNDDTLRTTVFGTSLLTANIDMWSPLYVDHPSASVLRCM